MRHGLGRGARLGHPVPCDIRRRRCSIARLASDFGSAEPPITIFKPARSTLAFGGRIEQHLQDRRNAVGEGHAFGVDQLDQ